MTPGRPEEAVIRRHQQEDRHPAGQRLGYAFHELKLLRTRQPEKPALSPPVHGHLDQGQ